MLTKIKYLPVFALASILFQSCENTTIEEDMSRYCDCRKQLISQEVDEQECLDIMEELSIKYEYDPEAATEIKKEIKKCNDKINEQIQ